MGELDRVAAVALKSLEGMDNGCRSAVGVHLMDRAAKIEGQIPFALAEKIACFALLLETHSRRSSLFLSSLGPSRQ